MVKTTCKCGYTWEYGGESVKRYITCPSCYAKTPNPNFKNPKDE